MRLHPRAIFMVADPFAIRGGVGGFENRVAHHALGLLVATDDAPRLVGHDQPDGNDLHHRFDECQASLEIVHVGRGLQFPDPRFEPCDLFEAIVLFAHADLFTPL